MSIKVGGIVSVAVVLMTNFGMPETCTFLRRNDKK